MSANQQAEGRAEDATERLSESEAARYLLCVEQREQGDHITLDVALVYAEEALRELAIVRRELDEARAEIARRDEAEGRALDAVYGLGSL